MVKRTLLFLTFGILLGQVRAQEVTPVGRFAQDSMKLGEEIQFSLSVTYPKGWQVIFPDSTFNYAPFEFSQKRFWETQVDSTLATDSVIYTLSSFEIDSIQSLQLPVFIQQGDDSIQLLSNFDSIYLQQMITVLPDSIKLRQNLAFKELDYSLNYLYLSIGMGILLILGLGTYFLFGKQIKNKYLLYVLNKDYKKFILSFDEGISEVKAHNDNTKQIESLLLLWKQFMERLENRPFTKYTSKEILSAGYGEGLKSVLQEIDKSIYGRVAIEDIHKNLDALGEFTSERFEIKREEVKNG